MRDSIRGFGRDNARELQAIRRDRRGIYIERGDYPFGASPRFQYDRRGAIMIVLSATIRHRITCSGFVDRIFQREALDSTVEEAKRLISEEKLLASNALIITDCKKDRDSGDSSEGLYFSLIIPEKMDESFGRTALLAVAETIEDFFNRGTSIERNNRILIGGKRVAEVDFSQMENHSIFSVSIDDFSAFYSGNLSPEEYKSANLLPKWAGSLLGNMIYRIAAYHFSFKSNGFTFFQAGYENRLMGGSSYNTMLLLERCKLR
jgi:hypothetical protein